jgi:hypothetical protein
MQALLARMWQFSGHRRGQHASCIFNPRIHPALATVNRVGKKGFSSDPHRH